MIIFFKFTLVSWLAFREFIASFLQADCPFWWQTHSASEVNEKSLEIGHCYLFWNSII